MERVAFRREPLIALLLGAGGLVAGVLLGSDGVFYQSWLLAFLFWVGVSLGALALLSVGHMAGGSWSALIQRPLEASVSLLPIMALFFLPILFGMNVLYLWTDAAYVASHPLVAAIIEAYEADTDELMGIQLQTGDGNVQQAGMELYQNIPNPFISETRIGFWLPEAGRAELMIRDVAGRVLRVIEGDYEQGYNEVRLDRQNLPAGTLYYTLTADDDQQTKVMLLER